MHNCFRDDSEHPQKYPHELYNDSIGQSCPDAFSMIFMSPLVNPKDVAIDGL